MLLKLIKNWDKKSYAIKFCPITFKNSIYHSSSLKISAFDYTQNIEPTLCIRNGSERLKCNKIKV